MIHKAIVILLLLMVINIATEGTAVRAQNWSCTDSDDMPQQGMNYCALLDFQKADAELNAAWKDTFPKIKAHDQEVDEDLKGWGKNTLDAQRAWITYRDAHCTSEGFKFRGGSMERLIYNSCRANLTRQRTRQIRNLMEDG